MKKKYSYSKSTIVSSTLNEEGQIGGHREERASLGNAAATTSTGR
jgi:hypothetical protein